MTSGPVLDFDPSASSGNQAAEPVDTRDAPISSGGALLFAVAFFLTLLAAVALGQFVQSRATIIRRGARNVALATTRAFASHWRDVILFTLLGIIAFKLW